MSTAANELAAACLAAALLVSGAVPAMAEAPPTLDLSGDEPIPAADIHAAVFAWNGQEVVLGGYLEGTMRSKYITQRIGIAAAPGQERGLAECEMTNASNERVRNDPPIVIRGTVVNFNTFNPDRQPRLVLRNCELVSIDETFDESAPAVLGSDQPIPVAALYEAIAGWFGKEASVVGHYHSSTHSSADNRTRVDLQADQAGPILVGCHIPGQDVVPQSVVDDRSGVVMRGTLGEPTADRVVLEDCSFSNRQ